MSNSIADEVKSYGLQDAVMALKAKLKDLLSGQDEIKSGTKALRFEFACVSKNLIAWLNQQTGIHKIYFSDREKRFAIAAIGNAHSLQWKSSIKYSSLVEHMKQYLTPQYPLLRYYGGICFDPDNYNSYWDNFGTCRFFIPRFELFTLDGNTRFACNLIFEDASHDVLKETLQELDELTSDIKELPDTVPEPYTREDSPVREQWNYRIEGIMDSLAKGSFKKVVLARKSTFSFDQPVNPHVILNRLHHITSECFVFGLQFAPNEMFLGASPERLFRRHKQNLFTEAVAGTRPRGLTEKEDKDLKEKLKSSDKDLLEQKIVVQMLKDRMKKTCCSLKSDPRPKLLTLNGSHHLMTKLQGILKDGIDDAKLLELFHPTPAVAGYPVTQSLIEIKNKEPFCRGWYCGPVGYIGNSETEFIVAIRSGLLKEKTLDLFAGAGIVHGSTAHTEWEEIEHKLNSILKIFTHESRSTP